MDETTKSVAVIGGGASGLAAAISAAYAGAQVTIFEASKRVGQKILKTGNGRCNLTNTQVAPTDYFETFYVEPLIEAYPAARVLDFFDKLGLLTIEEDDGRVYPFSNTANTVLDVLRNSCACLGITVLCESEVVKVVPKDARYEVVCAQGATHVFDRVIVSTGGGTDLLSGLGHEIVPFHPVLCPLATDVEPLRGLSGVRAHAKVSAYESMEAEEPYAWLFGEVLFREYGLSGIVIFDMSREVELEDYLGLDFLPQATTDEFIGLLTSKYENMKKCTYVENISPLTYSDLMCGIFHTRLNNAIVHKTGCKPSSPVDPAMFAALVATAKDFRVRVTGLGDASKAQVTRGGAAIDEFDLLTLESKLNPGLFAAGETLSVDGRCGGFNLHWAWASGMAAGAAAAAD